MSCPTTLTRVGDGAVLEKVSAGLPDGVVRHFHRDEIPSGGIATIENAFELGETACRVREVVDAQSDTVWFGAVEFASRATEVGVETSACPLFLLGGPGAGGKVIQAASTLGLNAFCQKLLIWDDGSGRVHVSFNDHIALAEPQGSMRASRFA